MTRTSAGYGMSPMTETSSHQRQETRDSKHTNEKHHIRFFTSLGESRSSIQFAKTSYMPLRVEPRGWQGWTLVDMVTSAPWGRRVSPDFRSSEAILWRSHKPNDHHRLIQRRIHKVSSNLVQINLIRWPQSRQQSCGECVWASASCSCVCGCALWRKRRKALFGWKGEEYVKLSRARVTRWKYTREQQRNEPSLRKRNALSIRHAFN